MAQCCGLVGGARASRGGWWWGFGTGGARVGAIGGEARLGRELRLRRVAQRRLDRAVLQAQWWVVRRMVLWTVGHAVGTGGEGWTRLGEKHASGVRSISIASLGAASTAPSCRHSGGLCKAHGPVDCGPRCEERGVRWWGVAPGARARPSRPCSRRWHASQNLRNGHKVIVRSRRLFRCMWKGVRNSDRTPPRGVCADACAGGWRRVRPRRHGTWRGAGTAPGRDATRPSHTRPSLRASAVLAISERLTRG